MKLRCATIFAFLIATLLASGCASTPAAVRGPQVLQLERCPSVPEFVPAALPEPESGGFVSFDTPEMQAALALRDVEYESHMRKLRAALDCYERQVEHGR